MTEPQVTRWALFVSVTYVVQLALGALNLLLLAPAAVQIAHLLLADLLWLSLVGLTAHTLAARPHSTQETSLHPLTTP